MAEVTCSFCGRNKKDVDLMISGIHAHICDKCVTQASTILLEEKKNKVELWGTGSPMREFLHADDLADACVFLMKEYNENSFINIGTGLEVSIKDLAKIIKKLVEYQGEVVWNAEKPDGTPRKLMDVSKLHQLGWKHTIELEEGIKKVYSEYKVQIGV